MKFKTITMKIILTIIAIVFIIFIAIQLLAMNGQKNIETYKYDVIKTYHDFEIRFYKSTLFSSVKLSSSDFKTSSSQGFSILAGYIFGKNENNEKISMTSPVTMSLEDSVTMMFMVPKEYNKERLPKPLQKDITFIVEPSKKMAAISFGGWANDEKIDKYKQQLITNLKAEGILFKEKFYFFGYNPPYEVFNRKNEILVELQ